MAAGPAGASSPAGAVVPAGATGTAGANGPSSATGTAGRPHPAGHLFVLIGPGGAGKTAIISAILSTRPAVRFIPTTTTRPPRPSEQHGREYFFVSDSDFTELRVRGDLLESERTHGNWYGTSRRRIAELLAAGRVGITSLDYRGGQAVRSAFPRQTTTIFVRPGSLDELRARLEARPGANDADVRARLERASEEMAHAQECDYIVENGNSGLDGAVGTVLRIMDHRLGRQEADGGLNHR